MGSNFAGQLGIFLIYNIYAYTLVRPSVVMPKPINLCEETQRYCDSLLNNIGCPTNSQQNVACTDFNDYKTFQGICSCGDFDADRVNELMVDAQVSILSLLYEK